MKRIITLAICIAMLGSLALTSLTSCGGNENDAKYNEALALIDNGDYEEAYDILEALGEYKDSEKLLSRFYTFMTHTTRTINGESKGTEISLNEDNLPCKITAKNIDGDICVYEYFYDEEKQISKQNVLNFDGTTGVYDYFYNSDGTVSKVLCTPVSEILPNYYYTYDANGNLLTVIIEFGDESTNKYEYVYDSLGNLVKETRTARDGDVEICIALTMTTATLSARSIPSLTAT